MGWCCSPWAWTRGLEDAADLKRFRGWRPVAQCRVRPFPIVVLAPCLDQHLRLAEGVELTCPRRSGPPAM